MKWNRRERKEKKEKKNIETANSELIIARAMKVRERVYVWIVDIGIGSEYGLYT